ncbi:uncharacterized protein METZ01_LOCUS345796, partial [marine metagenome]
NTEPGALVRSSTLSSPTMIPGWSPWSVSIVKSFNFHLPNTLGLEVNSTIGRLINRKNDFVANWRLFSPCYTGMWIEYILPKCFGFTSIFEGLVLSNCRPKRG